MNLQFGLVGHPVFHSISPFIHSRLFELSKIPADYRLFDIPQKDLADSLPFLNSLCGYNVTIPHKQRIIPFLDALCDKADLYKCVNTVKNDGSSVGFNTDANGFLSALSFEKIEKAKKRILFAFAKSYGVFILSINTLICGLSLSVPVILISA